MSRGWGVGSSLCGRHSLSLRLIVLSLRLNVIVLRFKVVVLFLCLLVVFFFSFVVLYPDFVVLSCRSSSSPAGRLPLLQVDFLSCRSSSSPSGRRPPLQVVVSPLVVVPPAICLSSRSRLPSSAGNPRARRRRDDLSRASRSLALASLGCH